jgi:gas vesicle protein
MNDHTPDCASRGSSYSAMTFAFLAGGLAGATVALLLAPHTGRVTRTILGRKLNEAAEASREVKGRMVDKLNDVADAARDLKDRAIRRGREVGEDATQRLENAGTALVG